MFLIRTKGRSISSSSSFKSSNHNIRFNIARLNSKVIEQQEGHEIDIEGKNSDNQIMCHLPGDVMSLISKHGRRYPSRKVIVHRFYTSEQNQEHKNNNNNYSQSQSNRQEKEERSNNSVGYWLLFTAGVVFVMVVVGGVTRLTESGLSMTEWHPVTGILPPMTDKEWEEEFEKYKQYPEFKILNRNMKIEEFKKIFYMEWFHRVLGRSLGFIFGLPFIYYLSRGFLNSSLKKKLGVLFGLGGLQGLIGWWMVKSGLSEDNYIPRVSPYRLTVHLTSAIIIYLGLLWTGLTTISPIQNLYKAKPVSPGLTRGAMLVGALTLLTAISGAFVAGNDAGLVYNEFPYMGEGLVPEEYWDIEPTYKNFFENPEAVQFNHRLLAMTTLFATTIYWIYARKAPLPKRAKIALHHVFGMAYLQATLGITTLLHHVPVPLAATHQAGSLTLLTFVTALIHQLKKIPKVR